MAETTRRIAGSQINKSESDKAMVVHQTGAAGGGELLHFTVDTIIRQTLLIAEVMDKAMIEGVHYGKIEGCGDKPALSKAGAEKLAVLFRFGTSYQVTITEYPGWHREYDVRCILKSVISGDWIGEGVGCCSTLETKYRYRNEKPVCPECGKDLFRSKAEFGGGWFCWGARGGCGLNLEKDDDRIPRELGKVENPDPPDQWNTVLKMAKKRAMVDAILSATAASDSFTQDIEELASYLDEGPITGEIPHDPSKKSSQNENRDQSQSQNQNRKPAEETKSYSPSQSEIEMMADLEGDLVELSRKCGMKGQRRNTIVAAFQTRAKSRGMIYGSAFIRNEIERAKLKVTRSIGDHIAAHAEEKTKPKLDGSEIDFDLKSMDPDMNPIRAFSNGSTINFRNVVDIGSAEYLEALKAFDEFVDRWMESDPGAFAIHPGDSVDKADPGDNLDPVGKDPAQGE